MSDIFEQLISSTKQRSPQPELLEALGKKAAALYLQNETSLNESIVKLASEYSNLNNEHVKRIAEFANNTVFQGLHSRNEDKNVHFPIANPSTIIQDLRDGGSPLHDGKTLNTGLPQNKRSSVPLGVNTDYQLPPRSIPNTSGFDDQASGMAELDRRNQTSGIMGTGEPITKEASTSWSHNHHANPIEDVFDAHIRLRAVREKLASTHEDFDLALQSAKEDFYQEVKNFIMDPDSPGLMSVVNAIKLASPTDSFAFQILRPVSERLVKEGAIRTDKLQKIASQKIINNKHPLLVAYYGILKMAEEKVRSKEALLEINKLASKTTKFLKEHV